MENSNRFFKNTECAYYPCHEGIEEINCLFCYCPMYHLDDCPGDPSFKEKNGRRIKVCTVCSFPHKAENYDKVVEIIKENLKREG